MKNSEEIARTVFDIRDRYLENKKHMPMLTPIIKKSLREAYFSPKEIIPKNQAVGRLSGEVVVAYR